MVFFVVMVVVVLIILTVSSIHDIKSREVPDLLSWGLVIVALAIRGLFSFAFGWEMIVSGIIGFAVCFAISLLLYYSGQWGGADSKLLAGMGAVMGVDFLFTRLETMGFSQNFELLGFVILLLICGAIYSLIWSVGLAIMNKDHFINEFRLLFYDSLGYFKAALIVFVLGIILGIARHWIFLSFALIIILSYFLFVGIVAVERSSFVKKREIPKLVEGDWLAEKVTGNKGDTIYPKTLDESDLKKLNHWFSKCKVKQVVIKEGVPFVPAFWIAYILLLLQGYWIHFVVGLFGF